MNITIKNEQIETIIGEKIDLVNRLVEVNKVEFPTHQKCIRHVSKKTIPPKERLSTINSILKELKAKIKADKAKIEVQITEKID